MKRKRLVTTVFVFLISLIFVCGTISLVLQYNATASRREKLDFGDAHDYSDGWHMMVGGKTTPIDSLPISIGGETDSIIIKKTLPSTQIPKELLLASKWQAVEVYADGETIYTYGSLDDIRKGNLIEDVLCRIKIPDGLQGQTLFIKFTSPRDYHNVPQILAGDSASILKQIVKSNLPILLFSIITMLIAVMLIIVFIAQMTKHVKTPFMIYSAIMIVLLNIWILTDSTLLQMVIPNAGVLSLLSLFAFLFLPIPFSLFINSLVKNKCKCINYVCGLCALNGTAAIIASLFCPIWVMMFLLPAYVIMGLSLAVIVVVLIREWRIEHSFDSMYLLSAMIVLIVFVVLEYMQFFSMPSIFGNSSLVRLAVMIFIVMLTGLAIIRRLSSLQERAKLGAYRKMAYRDSLTGLGNRMKYDKCLNNLQETSKLIQIGVISGDINNLKETNDACSHQAGDTIICGTAECYEKAFAGLAKCYRIGGDEFVALFIDTEVKMEEMLEQLNNVIIEYNSTHAYPIKISLGSAIGFVDTSEGKNLIKLLNTADKNMYENKRKYHGNLIIL